MQQYSLQSQFPCIQTLSLTLTSNARLAHMADGRTLILLYTPHKARPFVQITLTTVCLLAVAVANEEGIGWLDKRIVHSKTIYGFHPM